MNKYVKSFGKLEDIEKCTICGCDKLDVIITGQYHEDAPADIMNIVECQDCNFMMTNPRPTDEWYINYLNRHTNTTGKKGFTSDSFEESYRFQYNYKKGISLIKKNAKGTKLLDVGCGAGLFVKFAQENGFDSVGIDIEEEAIKEGVSKGLNLKCGELTDIKFPEKTFDVITLWNVIEHVKEPVKIVKECYRILKPDGLLGLETPNMLLFRLLTKLRVKKIGPQALFSWTHINHFTPAVMKRLLNMCGFNRIKFFTQPVRTYSNNFGRIKAILKKILFQCSFGRINIYFPLSLIAQK